MYLPESFVTNDRNKIVSFIKQHSLADLVTVNNGALSSNKVPLYFDEKSRALYGHFSKQNPQLIDLELDNEVLVIFSGAQAYVSPRDYRSKDMVPTWNFQTLQVRGRVSISNEKELITTLDKLSQYQEKDSTNPWSMTELNNEKLQKMLEVIVGYKIEIQDVKFKEKMSQNREVKDQQSIITALSNKDSQDEKNVSEIMREIL